MIKSTFEELYQNAASRQRVRYFIIIFCIVSSFYSLRIIAALWYSMPECDQADILFTHYIILGVGLLALLEYVDLIKKFEEIEWDLEKGYT